MFRLYTPIAILQCYCLYDAYTKKVETWWFMIIVFFPLIGSLIYLYKFVYSSKKIDAVGEKIKQTINKGHQIQQLEKELAFSDTISNRMALGEQYLIEGFLEEAYEMYKSCHKGMYKEDLSLLLKLVQCSYLTEDYLACKRYGDIIVIHHEFKPNDAKAAYAWSIYYLGNKSKSNELFNSFDVPFTNYTLRLEFVFYLLETNREEQGLKTLEAMLDEFDVMDPYERKMKKQLYKHLLKVRNEIS